MLSPPAFAHQDALSDYVLANICLLDFIFANLMGIHGISFVCVCVCGVSFESAFPVCEVKHLITLIGHLGFLGQMEGYLIAAFATSYRKPN